ncbi:MAG: GatB/YqeY domain-containing protein [Mollicutes bacterium]|nr:GatB/YqeY domain-containing protein [Mollicutes bacterium]
MLEQINNDLTKALKSGDKFELSALRMLKSELKNAEINKKETLTDDEILMIIKKQVKIRNESKVEYTSYGRSDLAGSLEKEIAILSKYLPEELSEAEIIKIIDEIILNEKATDIKAMGSIIKIFQSKYGSRADMKIVSNIVKDKLSNL